MGTEKTEDMIVLEVRHVSKFFPGVKALQDINVKFCKGEVHVLIGENGAGKSTLMKIMDGIYKADEGEIYLHGEKIEIMNPKQASMNGIAMIHQELNPVLDLTIAENIFLGKEERNGVLLNYRKMNDESKKLLEQVGMGAFTTGSKTREMMVDEFLTLEFVKGCSSQPKVDAFVEYDQNRG